MENRRKTVSRGARRKRATIPESSSTAESKCFLAELPHGMIMDILSRLPIKSLFNCKFVCKTWLHLISDPHFAKLHQARSSTAFLIQDDFFSKELFLTQIVEEVSRKSFLVEKLRFVPDINFPDTNVHVVNSCNGLVCLYGKSEDKSHQMVRICNPILGEYITIPIVEKHRKCEQFMAFGFSSLCNEYKLLQTFYLDEPFTTQCLAEIYTVGTGQWRSIGNAPFSLFHLDVKVFLNDSIHWVDYNPENDSFICAFDFGCEQFRQLSLPPDSQIHNGRGRHSVSCVGILKGCLSVVFDVCSECEEIEIWVMEEYGIKESWSKKFMVRNPYLYDENEHLDYFVSYEPLFSLSSGEILLLQGDQCIVCYDPKSKYFKVTGITRGMKSIKMTAYSPSFVSLQDTVKGEELKVLRH